jgi:transposase-like protein
MMTAKTQTYTPEQTAKMVADYESGSTVEQIANTVGKSVRSVVAKLAREGVYQAKAKTAGNTRVRKAELVDMIAGSLGVPAETVESLEKATHEALELVVQRLVKQ